MVGTPFNIKVYVSRTLALEGCCDECVAARNCSRYTIVYNFSKRTAK